MRDIRDEVWGQAEGQLRDQLWAQVWDQLGAQVWYQGRGQVGDNRRLIKAQLEEEEENEEC